MGASALDQGTPRERSGGDRLAGHLPQTLPSFWQLQCLAWGSYYAVLVSARLDHRPLLGMMFWQALHVAFGVAMTFPLRRLLHRFWSERRPVGALATVCVSAALPLAMLWSAGHSLVREPGMLSVLWQSPAPARFAQLFIGTINDTVVLSAWGFGYLTLMLARALQGERERTILAQSQALTSQLRALQYQINPHLIFNTLNGISTLVLERRTDDANHSILLLSRLLRSALRTDRAAIVSLAEELQLAGEYLDVEQVRFGDSLVVQQSIDRDAYNAEVPALLLQPLLENAIVHGRPTDGSRLTITLLACVTDGVVRIDVRNSGSGGRRGPSRGTGTGLANVRERLRALYGDEQAVRTGPWHDTGFLVQIELPFRRHVPAMALAAGQLEPGPR
jgi:hypothetical protein